MSPNILTSDCSSLTFSFYHPHGYGEISHCGFDFDLLISNDAWYLFILLIHEFHFFIKKCLSISLMHWKLICSFMLFSGKGSLHILKIIPLQVMWFTKAFFHLWLVFSYFDILLWNMNVVVFKLSKYYLLIIFVSYLRILCQIWVMRIDLVKKHLPWFLLSYMDLALSFRSSIQSLFIVNQFWQICQAWWCNEPYILKMCNCGSLSIGLYPWRHCHY